MAITKNNSLETGKCKNCGFEVNRFYCPECGQKVYHERFTLRVFTGVILHAFDIEHGFFYTAKMLLVDPGKMIREYLNGRTKDYYNPLKYFFLIVGINIIFMMWFGFVENNISNVNEIIGKGKEVSQAQTKMVDFMMQFMNFIVLLLLPVYSLISKMYYKKYKLHYGEQSIIICFIHGQTILITILFLPFFYFIPALNDYLYLFAFIIALIYYSYSLKRIFKTSLFKAILGSLTISIFGLILFMIIFFIIFSIIINLLKFFGFSFETWLNN